MKRTIHVCLDVTGAIKNWNKKYWDKLGADNGMTGARKLYDYVTRRGRIEVKVEEMKNEI